MTNHRTITHPRARIAALAVCPLILTVACGSSSSTTSTESTQVSAAPTTAVTETSVAPETTTAPDTSAAPAPSSEVPATATAPFNVDFVKKIDLAADGYHGGSFFLGPDGKIYILDLPFDTSDRKMFVFDADGTFLEVWGSSGTGAGQFGVATPDSDPPFPGGFVDFDSDGNLVIADSPNHRVQLFDTHGTFIREVSAATGATDLPDAWLGGMVTTADGGFYTAGWQSPLSRFDSTGKLISTIELADAPILNPDLLTPDGGLLALDLIGGKVHKFDADGKLVLTFGSSGVGPDKFVDIPYGTAVDAGGRYFAASEDKIIVFDPEGNYLASITQAGDTKWGLGSYVVRPIIRGDVLYTSDVSGDLFIFKIS